MDLKAEIQNLKDKIKTLEDVNSRLQRLEDTFKVHEHNGISSVRIQLDDLVNMIDVVSSAPTHVPRDFFEQFKIYKSGTTYRFYWYDGTGWRYATGT